MKKLVIAGSSKLVEQCAYWRGYFEGRGYDVIDYPSPVPFDDEHANEITDVYTSFYQNLDRTDILFVMNEDKDGIGGYIGPSAIAELTYAIIGNLNHGKKVEITLLQMPSEDQKCFGEVKFWLNQGWIQIYNRPTGKKVALANTISAQTDLEPELDKAPDKDYLPSSAKPTYIPAKPSVKTKTINILTCRKRCLHGLTSSQREYLHLIASEFPAWLLKYIAAPEFQRLRGVSMDCGMSFTGIHAGCAYHSVFVHSIGVALLLWRFTHDRVQTLAGLLHDISSPAFKHCIDYLNGDAETQESIESRTSETIRNARTIMRQLKRDGIMAGEISEYRLFPLADNDVPGLAADRLEYTMSLGYFTYEAWTLEQIKRFSNNITILTNENNIAEFGFRDLSVAKEFTLGNLKFSAVYHSAEDRAAMQLVADILKSMILRNYLTMDDLYNMSEREVVDWILSCGDRNLSEAFRNLQRATSAYGSNTIKRDRYCASVKSKVRYIDPLVAGDTEVGDNRTTNLSKTVQRAVTKYLNTKQSKYVGFDFEFTPYSE